MIGEKLKHSFSSEIHNKIGNYTYEIREISKNNLPDFMCNKNFKAINVTIPYKKDVIKYLDYIDESVTNIGACNTIVNKNNKLYGYNTDYLGILELIEYNNIDIKNKKCAILGTGGTANTAKYCLNLLGAKEVLLVSRFDKLDTITYNELKTIHKDIEVIFNTTPKEMYPNDEEEILDSLDEFDNLYAVIDTIYNPLHTNLVLKAKEKNIKCCGGLYMLISQAFYASELFQDVKLDKSIIDDIYNEYIKSKRNIVFIGMPGSGKSTISNKLAGVLHKKFIDTDEEIKKIIGMEISDYINQFGENKFRDIEEFIIKNLSIRQGIIIATGGGSILRKINIDRLKRNGSIYFINRSLNNLKISKSRPLSSNYDDLKKRYMERYELYQKYKDIEIDGDLELNDKIKLILEEI